MDSLLIGLIIGLSVVAVCMTRIAFRENRLRHAAEIRAHRAESWRIERMRQDEIRARATSVGRRELAKVYSILRANNDRRHQQPAPTDGSTAAGHPASPLEEAQ